MDPLFNKRTLKCHIDHVIGKNIRAIRQVRRLHKDELAKMVGIGSSHISLIERVDRGVTAVNLSKLSKVLDVSIDALFAEPSSEGVPFLGGQNSEDHANRLKIKNAIGSLANEDLELVLCLIKGMMKNKQNDSGF